MVTPEYQGVRVRDVVRIRSRPWLFVLSRVGFFFAGICILGLVTSLWIAPWTSLTPLTSALAILLLAMLAMHLRKGRILRARLILQHLASAVSLGMPISPYLYAAAGSERPGIRKRMKRLGDHIESGVPLGTAMHLATGELPLRIAGQLDAAQETGDLQATLQRLVAPREDAIGASPNAGGMAYVLAVSLAVFGAFTLIAIFVLPKFYQIFHDFGLKLPWLTTFVFDTSEVLGPYLAILLLLFAVVVITHHTRLVFTSRIPLVWYRRLVDHVYWYVPGIGRLTRDQNYADLASSLAGALRAGHTLDHALAVQYRAHLNAVLERRVGAMHRSIRGGADPAAAASDAGFPQLLVSLLRQEHQPDLARAMSFAASAYAARYGRLMVTMQAVLPVAITLCFGAMGVCLALSLFLPLAALINGMDPFKGISL